MALHPKRLNFQTNRRSLFTANTPPPQKSNFSNWHIPSSESGQTDPKLIFFNQALFYVNGHVYTKQNTGAQEIPILRLNFYLIMQNFIFGTPCEVRIANHVHFSDSINSEWHELLGQELHSHLLPQAGREGKAVTLARSTCRVGRPCTRTGAKYPPCKRTQDTAQNTSNK